MNSYPKSFHSCRTAPFSLWFLPLPAQYYLFTPSPLFSLSLLILCWRAFRLFLHRYFWFLLQGPLKYSKNYSFLLVIYSLLHLFLTNLPFSIFVLSFLLSTFALIVSTPLMLLSYFSGLDVNKEQVSISWKIIFSSNLVVKSRFVKIFRRFVHQARRYWSLMSSFCFLDQNNGIRQFQWGQLSKSLRKLLCY